MSLFACQFSSENPTSTHPLKNVGDIPPDPKLDSDSFQVCHEDLILQYYNFGNNIQYEGEKAALIEFVHQNYKIDPTLHDSGYVTIRFIVNCKGETGRFRVFTLDNEYKETVLSPAIVDQLTNITRSLKGWKPGKNKHERSFDYYQYLTFKISDGRLTDIMP